MLDFTEFENLESIEPSDNWKQSLMEKLDKVKPESLSGYPKGNLLAIVMLVVLINIGFILNSIISNPNKTSNRNKELQIISKELLINQLQ